MWHVNWNDAILNNSIFVIYVFKWFHFDTLIFLSGFILVHEVCEMIYFGPNNYIWWSSPMNVIFVDNGCGGSDNDGGGGG